MPKASTIKKAKTTNNNKKSNKFDLKKNWKKTVYVGMAGFLFFLSVGYGGLTYIKEKRALALWSSSSTPPAIQYACQYRYIGDGMNGYIVVYKAYYKQTTGLSFTIFNQYGATLKTVYNGYYSAGQTSTAKSAYIPQVGYMYSGSQLIKIATC